MSGLAIPAPQILLPGQPGNLVDHLGNSWGLGPSGSAVQNGVILPSGHGTLVLVLSGQPATVWALSANNSLWYEWTGAASSPWTLHPAGILPPGISSVLPFVLDPDLAIWASSTGAQQAAIIAIQTLRRTPFGKA